MNSWQELKKKTVAPNDTPDDLQVPFSSDPEPEPPTPKPPGEEEENPFQLADDQTAIDTIDKLTTYDQENKHNNGMKAILVETLGVTGLQIQADYCKTLEEKYGFKSKVRMFNETTANWLYVHSAGYKGMRAQQGFTALQAQIQQNLNLGFDGTRSKADKLMGR